MMNEGETERKLEREKTERGKGGGREEDLLSPNLFLQLEALLSESR